jgi:hypothetical protein
MSKIYGVIKVNLIKKMGIRMVVFNSGVNKFNVNKFYVNSIYSDFKHNLCLGKIYRMYVVIFILKDGVKVNVDIKCICTFIFGNVNEVMIKNYYGIFNEIRYYYEDALGVLNPEKPVKASVGSVLLKDLYFEVYLVDDQCFSNRFNRWLINNLVFKIR